MIVVHHWPESDAFVSELSALRHGSDERSEGVSARELLAWKDVLAELGSIVDDVATATRALHAIELKG